MSRFFPSDFSMIWLSFGDIFLVSFFVPLQQTILQDRLIFTCHTSQDFLRPDLQSLTSISNICCRNCHSILIFSLFYSLHWRMDGGKTCKNSQFDILWRVATYHINVFVFNRHHCKGSSRIYVGKILAIFHHLPSPDWHFGRIFINFMNEIYMLLTFPWPLT